MLVLVLVQERKKTTTTTEGIKQGNDAQMISERLAQDWLKDCSRTSSRTVVVVDNLLRILWRKQINGIAGPWARVFFPRASIPPNGTE